MSKSLTRDRPAVAGASPRLWCLLNRHEPAGRRANWDGETYISRCRYCEAPIYRVKRGKWLRDRRKSRRL